MLTPYEFGRETGRRQAKIYSEIDEGRIHDLAILLEFEDKDTFKEGYRNGFTEAKAEQDDQGRLAAEAAFDDDDPFRPSASELAIALLEIEEAQLAHEDNPFL